MTAQEALAWFKEELKDGKCSDNCRQCNAYEVAIEALEKQIPKKPYKRKEHKQNDYYCTVCRRYLGDEMELKYACLQPEYCQHCGQALDWSDIE